MTNPQAIADGLSEEQFIAPDVSVVRYPFVREMRDAHWLASEIGDMPQIECWRPGIAYEEAGPEDVEAIAHGEGQMQLREVSCHKPGRYPERVFYERCFVDPDGKTFGRPKLHIATRQKFNRLRKGFAVYYEVRAILAKEEK